MSKVTNAELKQIITTNSNTTNSNFQKAKQAINAKVDKVEGKGLSTNDFTTEEKTKLGALPTNAELVAGYVAKDGSKVLSDNNFTNELKTKLEGLENAPSVTIEQAATPDSGMAATYQLKVGGVATGAKINVAKDKVIGTPLIKTCATANTPINGLAVGDKYVEFPIANSDEKQYLSVAELYNVYQQGNGIVFDGNQIKIDTTVVALKSDLPDTLSDLTDDLMTGYQKADSASAVEATDSVKSAIGKLEKSIDNKQPAGNYLTEHQSLAGKQDKIDSTHKLDADLLSEGTTVKLLTAAERTAIGTIADKTTEDDVRDIINAVIGDLSITAWDDITIS